jgi:hypothetical protein
MGATFTAAVEAFLAGLTAVPLTVASSQSYPAFLGRVMAA